MQSVREILRKRGRLHRRAAAASLAVLFLY